MPSRMNRYHCQPARHCKAAAQQAQHACFAFGDACHDNGSQGRSHERVEHEGECENLGQHAPFLEYEGDQYDPGERVRHEKEEEQGMLPHHLSQASWEQQLIDQMHWKFPC